jgi:hypothetical protein
MPLIEDNDVPLWLTEKDSWQAESVIKNSIPFPRVFCGACGKAFEAYAKRVKAEKEARRIAEGLSKSVSSGPPKNPPARNSSDFDSVEKKHVASPPARELTYDTSKSSTAVKSVVAQSSPAASVIPPCPRVVEAKATVAKSTSAKVVIKSSFDKGAKKADGPWNLDGGKKRGIVRESSNDAESYPSMEGRRASSRSRKQCHQCSSIHTSTWWVMEEVEAEYLSQSPGKLAKSKTVTEPHWKGYSSNQVTGDTDLTCDECHSQNVKVLSDVAAFDSKKKAEKQSSSSSGRNKKRQLEHTDKRKKDDKEEEPRGYTNNLAELEPDDDDEDDDEEVNVEKDIVEIIEHPPIKTKEKYKKLKPSTSSAESTTTSKTAKTAKSSASSTTIEVGSDDKEREEEEEEEEEDEEEEGGKEEDKIKAVEKLSGRRQTRSCAICSAKTNIIAWWAYDHTGYLFSYTGRSAPMVDVFCGDCKTAGKIPPPKKKKAEK